jgi:hypothetical protein
MIQVLRARWFENIRETEFGVGTDTRLAEKDQEVKRRESLYEEAQMPLQ